MEIGLIVGEGSPVTWERWRHVIALAERLGYPSLFRSDHFFGGVQKDTIDVYLSFVLAATESQKLRFGSLVTPVTFRPPVVVGRMAQQLDALSDGRFVLGLGAGWFADEHRIYGLPFPATPERYDRLEEALELIKVLWYEEPGVYSGNYYKLDGTRSLPHPPRGRPKILIGGAGPKRTLRLVAGHADEWNATTLSVEGYRSAVEMLDRHCADVGRDPASVRRSMLIFVTSGPTKEISDLCGHRFVDLVAPGSGMTIEEMAAHLAGGPAPFTGGAEELIDHLGRLSELGLQEAIFEHFCTERDDFVEWIAADVAPHVARL